MLGRLIRRLTGRAAPPAGELAERLIAERRWPEAQAALEEHLRLDEKNLPAWNRLAYVLAMQGHLDEAATACERAVRLDPADAAAHANLGNVRRTQNRLDDAATCYAKALELDPRLPEVHHALGNVHREAGRSRAAIDSYRRALALEPDRADTQAYLGKLLMDEGQMAEALACYRRSVELHPEFPEAWNALGLGLWMSLRMPEAEAALRRALEQDAKFTDARLNLALLLMLLGRYEEGLRLYESRLEGNAQLAAFESVQRWNGEHLSGGTLFLWDDEGLGDAIMMLRYARYLHAKGAQKVVLGCTPALVRLAATAAGIDEVVPKTGAIAFGADTLHCPLSSLPLAFGTLVGSVPSDVPYLSVPSELKTAWAAQLAPVAGVRAGLVWSGSSIYKRSTLRNVPLDTLAPLASVPGVRLISLQKGEPAAEASRLPGLITQPIEECTDLLDTGALIEALDLVITVDTSVAHLAGALGKPVWLLNRYESEWRWGLEREDSIWYPTLRIFRQQRHGDWREPIARIAAALAAWK